MQARTANWIHTKANPHTLSKKAGTTACISKAAGLLGEEERRRAQVVPSWSTPAAWLQKQRWSGWQDAHTGHCHTAYAYSIDIKQKTNKPRNTNKNTQKWDCRDVKIYLAKESVPPSLDKPVTNQHYPYHTRTTAALTPSPLAEITGFLRPRTASADPSFG